jgi:serine/threonine protein phosphatase 1
MLNLFRSKRPAAPRDQVPPGIRAYAVGDIHGRLDLLARLEPLLDAAARDPDRVLIEVFLGDYIDRGPASCGVIDRLIARAARRDRITVHLGGNHEAMLLAALADDRAFLHWLDNGGRTTLLSYGVSPQRAGADPAGTRAALARAIPDSHRAFLRSLRVSFHHGGFFFAHAGVRPGVPLAAQDPEDLVWMREPFLSATGDLGAVVVHGHTPTRAPVFRENRIGIDTGAYVTGVLTCLLVTDRQVTPVDTTHPRLGGPPALPPART